MPISEYLKGLREKIGHELVLCPAVAAVIRNEAGQILVQQRSDNGSWEVPAGAVDPGETPAQALVREVYEETGLSVVPLRVIAVVGGRVITHPNGDRTEPTAILFECRVVGGTLEARDGEAIAFRYDDPKAMPTHPLFPSQLFAPGVNGVYFEWDERWLETLR